MPSCLDIDTISFLSINQTFGKMNSEGSRSSIYNLESEVPISYLEMKDNIYLFFIFEF